MEVEAAPRIALFPTRRELGGYYDALSNLVNGNQSFYNLNGSCLVHNNQPTRKRSRPSSPCLPSKCSKPSGVVSRFTGIRAETTVYVADRMRRMHTEMEALRRRQDQILVNKVQEFVWRKMQEKEIELEQLKRMNSEMEERVRNLSAESELWRKMAESNEATANSLRSNILEALGAARDHGAPSCGSVVVGSDEAPTRGSAEMPADGEPRTCRICQIRDCGVLLLPCRHLCICSSCAPSSSLQCCPVCRSDCRAFLYVNSLP